MHMNKIYCALVNTVMNLRIPNKVGSFFTVRVSKNFRNESMTK